MSKFEVIEGEVWKIVPGYERYEVSDLGRVRRKGLKNYHILQGKIDKCGYRQIGLIKTSGDQKWFLLGRLVAIVFLDAPDNPEGKFLTVNHKNRIKTDNRLVNLELVTVKQNTQHWLRSMRSTRELMTGERQVPFYHDGGVHL